MNKQLIDKLNRGIPLEKADKVIPWKTAWMQLQNFGNPTYTKHSEQREDYVWNQEQLLCGLTTNLTVMKWRHLISNILSSMHLDIFQRKNLTRA